MATYNSYINSYNNGLNRYMNRFNNPYSYSLGNPSEDMVSGFIGTGRVIDEPIEDGNRSFLDRAMDTLMLPNYAIAGAVDGAIDGSGDGTRTWYEGLWEGVKAGNPFGDGNIKGETTFSDVLRTGFGEAETTMGKIGQGTAGFVLDVLLDPTTYLTGGASALVKGTGKVGKGAQAFGKQVDTLAKSKYKDELENLQKAKYNGRKLAVSNDMVNQARGVEQTFRDSVSRGMTPDMAQEIVQKQLDTRNASLVKNGQKPITKSADEIAQDAERLAKEYNRVLGFREGGEITFGFGNLPFAPKSWQKSNIKLLGEEGTDKIRRFSDSIGLSSVYAGLRNFTYGSRIGKMLSTTSPLYKLANDDPGKLWEAMEFVSHTRGQKMDKLQEEKAIRDYFKSLNLTPAENKEILELLQDKTIWHQVAEKARFSDLEKVKNIKKSFEMENKQAQSELNEMLQKREIAQTWKDALDDEIVMEEDFLNAMRREFEEDFAKLDLKHINEKSQLENLLKHYTNELAEVENSMLKADTPENAILSLHEMSKKERSDMDVHMSKKQRTDTSGLKMKREARENASINDLLKKSDGAPGRGSTYDLKDALSNYVYGESGHFRLLGDHAIDELVDIIRKGGDSVSVGAYVEANPVKFADHMYDVHQRIAKELGYDQWSKDGYRDPLAKVLGINEAEAKNMSIGQVEKRLSQMVQESSLSDAQLREVAELQQLRAKRKVLQHEYGNMTSAEFQRMLSDEMDAELLKGFNMSEDGNLTFRREDFNNPDSREGVNTSARDEFQEIFDPKTGKYRTELVEGKNFKREATGESEYRPIHTIGLAERTAVVDDIISHGIFKKEAVESAGQNFARYIDRIIDEVNDLSVKQFNMGYMDMTPNQKKLALKLATNNVATGKHGLDSKIVNSAKQLAEQRVREESQKAILKEATVGSDVTYTRNGEEITSKIKEIRRNKNGDHAFLLENAEGKVTMVRPKDVVRMKTSRASMTPEEILARSDVAKSTVARSEELLEQIYKVQDELKQYEGKAISEANEALEFYRSRITEQQSEIVKLEKQQQDYVKMLEEANDENIAKLADTIKRQEEILASDDALETYLSGKGWDIEKMLAEADPVDAGRIWLDKRASSDKVAETVRVLRDKFMKIGGSEVEIGKLTEEQFKANLMDYVPHILTPEGEDYIRSLNEVTNEGLGKITQDLGYGLKYNPYARSRTTEGTISEINDHFRDALQGKNLFSENVADIYLARAMKHTELMYDDKYMRTMLDVFGKEIPEDGMIEEGYKAVMNFGMMQTTTRDIASMTLSTQISNDVSDFLSANFRNFKGFAQASGRNLDDFISEQVDNFLKQNYPDDKINDIFEGYLQDALAKTSLPSKQFAEDAVPLVELDGNQINAMRTTWNDAYDNYVMTLERSINSALERGDYKRIAEVQKRFEQLGKRTPPQIKQVNEVIVSKANQARKLQQAKDQSRTLKMYDKFLHFMKLNQTVVVPAFHTRNKMSNMFQNWLGVGRDAVDKDLQIATTVLAKNRGDIDSLKQVVDAKKFGHKQLSKPLNIDNPHQSLVDAVGLNNGQLHWSDVYELALRYDVIDTGQFARDIGAGAGSRGLFKGLRQTRKDGTVRNLDPTDTENFTLYQKGTEVGTVVENSDRILHFVSLLKQGKSIDEAVQSSKQFLFDYGDLTAFEQSVMKRIFPYYTWLRKNARLQVSQLVEQPEKYRTMAKVFTGIEHMTPEEDRMNPMYVSDWATDWIQLPVSSENEYGQREPILLSTNMPFMDLNRIPDPTKPVESLRELFSQSAPQIRNPVELGANWSAFFNDEIAGEDDNKAVAYGDYIMNQFGLGNIAGGFFGRDSGTDVGLHLLNSTTGVKMNSYDYETSKHMMQDELEEGNNDKILEAIQRLLGREE